MSKKYLLDNEMNSEFSVEEFTCDDSNGFFAFFAYVKIGD